MKRITELYNYISVFPEGGLMAFLNIQNGDHPFSKDERKKLLMLLAQLERCDRTPLMRDIMFAVSNDAVMYVTNPTDGQVIDAIKESYTAIRHVDNPTEEAQLLAYALSNNAVNFISIIKNPCYELLKAYYTDRPSTIQTAPEEVKSNIDLQNAILNRAPYAIDYPSVPWNQEAYRKAYERDVRYIVHLDNPTEEEIIDALSKYPELAKSMPNLEEWLKMYSVFMS